MLKLYIYICAVCLCCLCETTRIFTWLYMHICMCNCVRVKTYQFEYMSKWWTMCIYLVACLFIFIYPQQFGWLCWYWLKCQKKKHSFFRSVQSSVSSNIKGNVWRRPAQCNVWSLDYTSGWRLQYSINIIQYPMQYPEQCWTMWAICQGHPRSVYSNILDLRKLKYAKWIHIVIALL